MIFWLVTRGDRPRDRMERGAVAAIGTAIVLRVVWCTFVLNRVSTSSTDEVVPLGAASAMASGRFPTFGDSPTAMASPVHSVVLGALLRVSALFQGPGPQVLAMALNICLGALTIWIAFRLAASWFGVTTGLVTMWLLAVAPPLVVLTSLGTADTLALLVGLGVVAAISRLVRRPDALVRWHDIVALGVLVGLAALTQAGLFLLSVPALVAAISVGRRRRAGGAMGAVLVASIGLTLVPWTLVVAWKVQVVSPLATSSAGLACDALDSPASVPGRLEGTASGRCFGDRFGSDERSWFWGRLHDAADGVRRRPGRAVARSGDAALALVSAEPGPLHRRNQTHPPLLGEGEPLEVGSSLIDAAQGVILVLAALSLGTSSRARRCWPLWSAALVLSVAALVGADPHRYGLVLMVAATVFAAELLAAVDGGADRDAPSTRRDTLASNRAGNVVAR